MAATLERPAAVSPEVEVWAGRLGVAAYLPALGDLTARLFPAGYQLRVEHGDPDFPDPASYIVFEVNIAGVTTAGAVEARQEWFTGLLEVVPAAQTVAFSLSMDER